MIITYGPNAFVEIFLTIKIQKPRQSTGKGSVVVLIIRKPEMSVLVTRKSFKKHKAHPDPSFAAQALNHPELMLGNTYK